MWDRRAKVVRVHDGDNVTVILDQGYGDTKLFELRLLGTFAPELEDEGGPETREFSRLWVAEHEASGFEWPFIVTTARTRTDRDVRSFSRYVGTLTNAFNTRILNVDIMAFVNAKGYEHGTGAR